MFSLCFDVIISVGDGFLEILITSILSTFISIPQNLPLSLFPQPVLQDHLRISQRELLVLLF